MGEGTFDPAPGYAPNKILVRVAYGGDPDFDYVLVCLVCPPGGVVPLRPGSASHVGYPSLATLSWVARDHWRRERHPGWVEEP
jgi:hypothetical protein